VTYQHGRYLIPAMPVFFILGFIGVGRLILLLAAGSKIFNLARAGVVGLIILVGLGFYGIGAVSYGKDVAIIESEMVQTAVWLNENTQPDAVIAAHDIGAIGYFSNRRLLDLAGLVSPEVIPFIRDEPKLADYLNQNKADYLVTFPGWYPVLTSQGQKIFQTKGIFSPAEGGENMAVYRWGNSK
jgi:hypothetical protein